MGSDCQESDGDITYLQGGLDHIFFPLCSLERALFGVSILKLVITPENDVANKQYSLPNVIGLIATRE